MRARLQYQNLESKIEYNNNLFSTIQLSMMM